MILYFSGTGNSRCIAQKLADALGDELLDLGARIRAKDTSPVQTNGRIVLVAPTYAWRIPRIVADHLAHTELLGAKQAWFVMNCGSTVGNAAGYNEAFCQRRQLRYMGTAKIVMPENYIARYPVPDAEEARVIVARAEPKIDRAAEQIAAGQPFAALPITPLDHALSRAVNPLFYRFCVKASPFSVGSECIGCGKCARLCPLGNISLKDGKPVWGRDCTHCMACIAYCPAEAIEYGKKSQGKPRYRIEFISDRTVR